MNRCLPPPDRTSLRRPALPPDMCAVVLADPLHVTTDWFTAWPGDALVAVAKMFLADVEFGSEDTRNAIVEACQRFHEDTIVLSEEFLAKLRRQNYVTPTRYASSITQCVGLYWRCILYADITTLRHNIGSKHQICSG